MHKQAVFLSCSLAFILALPFASLHAQEESQEESQEVADEQKAYTLVDTKDEKALRENLGKKVTVFGTIKRTRKWDGGANFLNFDGEKFMLICFESEYPNFPDGLPADTLQDKNVEVTGYINEYKGKLQIKLTDPAQIKLIEPVKEDAAGDKKKGDDAKAGEGVKKDEAKEPAAKPKKVDPKKYFC
mgnify:CR=1 FL=1|jgi:hypothetical protein